MSAHAAVSRAEPAWPGSPAETGLALPPGLPFERWQALGATLGRLHRSSPWWVGDWLVYGERTYGERYSQALNLTGLEYQTLANCVWVASRIEFSRRREHLSWKHHAEVAACDEAEREAWLDLAERERLSARELRRRQQEARTRGGSTPAVLDAPAPVALPDEVCIRLAGAEALPLPDGGVDLIVTSPPYGLGVAYADSDDDTGYEPYLALARLWAAEMHRVAAPQGRLCLNVPLDTWRGGPRPFAADWLGQLRDAGWQYRTSIVWTKGNGHSSRSVARGSPDSPSAPAVMAPVEVILVCHKGDWNLRRVGPHDLTHDAWLTWTNGLWTFPGTSDPRHPAPFPEELPRRCISLFSFRGDVVLDPFCGSGTTPAVAARLGRRVVAFDVSPGYVEHSRARVAGVLHGAAEREGVA